MAIDGYLENDLEKTEAAIALDDEIDALEVEIDRACVRYITLRSPVSTDVRLIFVAIKASHDLERAGDEAHNIAKRTRNILLRDSKTLCTESIGEMTNCLFNDARCDYLFLDEDCEMAKRIIARDEEVDKINKENFLRLASKDASQHQDNSTQIETIFISKSIERIADHAKNLAEEVIYLLEGNLDSI